MRASEIVFSPNDTMAFNRRKLAHCLGKKRSEVSADVERLVQRYRKRTAHRRKQAKDFRICTAEPWKGDDVT